MKNKARYTSLIIDQVATMQQDGCTDQEIADFMFGVGIGLLFQLDSRDKAIEKLNVTWNMLADVKDTIESAASRLKDMDDEDAIGRDSMWRHKSASGTTCRVNHVENGSVVYSVTHPSGVESPASAEVDLFLKWWEKV